MLAIQKTFVADIHQYIGKTIVLRGWVYRLRVLSKTTFVVLKDCTGEAQCVTGSDALPGLHLKADDAVEIVGTVRRDERARSGAEVDIVSVEILKEHGVAGLERVFETGHVYRAEPHATRRHLTEYYSLDLEMGFIDGPEDVIQLERELLSFVFERLNENFEAVLTRYRPATLPSMLQVPTWEFSECLERLRVIHNRTDLVDDLDPEAERQLCAIAERECGLPAVFVMGFPLSGRPFYTHPRTESTAAGFDLLFNGLEITTGGQRLHRRADLESALLARGIAPSSFKNHLRMFELGMPPHGGLAIGLERLTAQILGLQNVREATLYPRDRYHVTP